MITPDIYIALVHHPIVNKHGNIVTTSVTNFDLHDLARTATTYGIKACHIVTPSDSQQKMVHYIKDYWQDGVGAAFNSDRKEAFDLIKVASTIEETCLTIKTRHAIAPRLIATSAKKSGKTITFPDLKEESKASDRPLLLLFGTGWGLAPSVMDMVENCLEPINGPTDYNHLPVRSAVAIVLDRLLGR